MKRHSSVSGGFLTLVLQYGDYGALVRLKSVQPPQIDRNSGKNVCYGGYQVKRQL